MAWKLDYRGGAPVPLEVDSVIPERLNSSTISAIERLPVALGNQEVPLGEFFTVTGTGGDLTVEFSGDLSGVHWVGARMSTGTILIDGSAGRHVGSEMSGGRIDVMGDAGDWVGAELCGGTIHVRGNSGHLVGAAYRGSRVGMRGGTILIDGNTGNELGHTMRRGLVVVGGDAGDLIGFNMLAGTIMVLGQVGIRHGAGMKRGTLALLGEQRPELLPTFRYACRFRPLILTMMRHHLAQVGFALRQDQWLDEVDLFNGDLITGGKGEVLLTPA